MKKAAIYFFGLMALVVGLLSLYTIFGDRVGVRTANLISYTAAVFWFVFMGSKWLGGGYSLREEGVQRVLPRLLLIHCAFLVLIFVTESIAFALQPRLPGSWLIDHGRDPSLFVFALMLTFVIIGTAQTYVSRGMLKRSLEPEGTAESESVR